VKKKGSRDSRGLKRAAGTPTVGFINTEVLKCKLHNRYIFRFFGTK